MVYPFRAVPESLHGGLSRGAPLRALAVAAMLSIVNGQSLGAAFWYPIVGPPQIGSYAVPILSDGMNGVNVFSSTIVGGGAPTTHFNACE